MVKYFLYAGIVQRLECGLAKAKMSVRFRLLAPFEDNLRTKLKFVSFYLFIIIIVSLNLKYNKKIYLKSRIGRPNRL